MSRAFVVTGRGASRRRVAVGSSMVIGRDAACTLVVADSAASRQHLEIRDEDGEWKCTDLGSSNGTEVNGVRTSSCRLDHGDKIRIGNTRLVFEISDDADTGQRDRTMFMPTVLDFEGLEQEPPPRSKSQDLLEAAYTLMNAVATKFNPCELVDSVLQTTVDAVGAQRGAILFAGPNGELAPCPDCDAMHTICNGVRQPARVSDLKISESVARRVLNDGESILYRFARSDSQIDTSESMMELNLTSILCVPIRTQSRILGILYLDTDIANYRYSQDDMLLAAAAGNSAGLALENARIHRSLLEKDRIDREIAHAWTIQEGFLIRDWGSDDQRFEVFGKTQPAKTVGGDFYDFVRLGDDSVGLLIGDVSGKGVPAALTMAQLLAEFRLFASDTNSPAEVLERLNERFAERSRRGTFCTMSYIRIDLGSGALVGASAGHHAALVIAGDRADTVVAASGPPIGILPGLAWSDETARLAPGQSLLLYTDGITEARSEATLGPTELAPPEYQLERLQRRVQAAHECCPRDLIDAVMDDVHRFCYPQRPHDDCTMIALRYRDRTA
jgi:serine phosphatase RsbU (regulator of sigma subunit)